jgi:hypothetical protein
MGRTAFTEPQCLYSRSIPLLPLWAVSPVQILSACTRVTFTFTFFMSPFSGPRLAAQTELHSTVQLVRWKGGRKLLFAGYIHMAFILRPQTRSSDPVTQFITPERGYLISLAHNWITSAILARDKWGRFTQFSHFQYVIMGCLATC